MHDWARSSLFFSAGFWAALVLIGAVSIYDFDYFEGGRGRGPTLQVHIWIATLGAVVSVFPAGFGFRLGSRHGLAPGPLLATSSGAGLGLWLCLIGVLLPIRISPGPTILLLVVLGAFCLAYLMSVIKNRLDNVPSNNRWRVP